MTQRARERLRRPFALLVAAALGAAGAGWLYWQTARDPEIPWLALRAPAAWILYPAAPSSSAHPAIALDAAFRRVLWLREPPRTARLEARCFRRCQVAVNGTALSMAAPAAPASAAWKEPQTGNPGPLLHAGANVILVRVANDAGPPVLWLSLLADGRRLTSDPSWEASLAGAAWRPARLATTPMSRWGTLASPPSPGANLRPAAAAAALLPLLLCFAALGAAALWTARALAAGLRRRRSAIAAKGAPGAGAPAAQAPSSSTAAWALAPLAIAALLWAALFWNNRGLDGGWGFDSEGHLDYLRAILEHGRLPLADEGWEMYQPPLYYLAAAALLRLAGHARVDASTVGLLRILGGCAFLLQSASLLGSLRLLFPDAPRRWLGGFCLGVFLPAQIYLLQYVTNEGWAAALSSAAIYCCLRCLRLLDGDPDRPSTPPALPFLLLGAVLGLAMLTKFSALVTVAIVTAVVAGRLIARRARAPGLYLRSLGAMLLGCLLLCGWHYVRVAAHFHRLLVGNWDRASGFAWWQHPGYHTRLDFVRFGDALRAPLLSAFHSVPDALYSTLWGDGMLAGSGLLAARPPWNYGLMAAGYLLALLPTAAIMVGLGAALRRLLRQPRAAELLLLGTLGATALAVLAMSLRVASFAQPKAFYGLSALVPLCAFGGWGLDLIAGGGQRGGRLAGRLTATAAYALFGAWACTAYASFWMRRPDPGPLRATAAALDPAGLLARARAAGPAPEAIAWLRRTVTASPDHPFAWLLLGDALARAGKLDEAMASWREALRVDAYSAPAHLHLGRVLGLAGHRQEALYHLHLAARLQASSPAP
jgi:hypothetical protein